MTVGLTNCQLQVLIISVHAMYAGVFPGGGGGEGVGLNIHNSIHKRVRILYHM